MWTLKTSLPIVAIILRTARDSQPEMDKLKVLIFRRAIFYMCIGWASVHLMTWAELK